MSGAIAWIASVRAHDLYWVEEPTASDDVLGHAAIRRAIAPMRVASGEHAHNRVLFKQLLQAQAHLAMFDYVAVSGTLQDRFIEFVDHLHEHFEVPAIVCDGRYVAPSEPGSGARMRPASVEEFSFPHGSAWTAGGSPAAEPMPWRASRSS